MKAKTPIDPWGIAAGYRDGLGKQNKISPKTRETIRDAMQIGDAESGGPADVKILKPGDRLPLDGPTHLTLEDGTHLQVEGHVPTDLPIGYHNMIAIGTGHHTHLLVSPGECYLPESLRWWGWAVQLYALRSAKSWGMGDLGDLREFAQRTAQKHQCDFILSNPLGAALPIRSQQPSPYYPSSRRFLNPLYLRVEDIPGAKPAGSSIQKAAAAGRALNDQRLIDRDTVFKLKNSALKILWQQFKGDAAFDRFCSAQGKPLQEYATFCALAERFQSGWTRWPQEFRRPDSSAVQRYTHNDEVRFHQWLQWHLAQQFKQATAALPLMQDLPVGVDPGGADAWSWQDLLARGASIGAPPDGFNADGQNWGMQPFIPHRLRASGYEPFRQTLQAMLRFGGGLRIDHVMGLFRLFWIPEKCSAHDGAYVYYPADELLAVLAIESQRARAIIVGEDLGTVEPGVRQTLHRHQVLSYRVLWFEPRPPKKYPKQSLAAVTTHDLFTVAGLWKGSDVAEQKKAGLHPNEKDTQAIRKKLHRRLKLKSDAPAAEAVERTYQFLAQSPSQLLTASLDDALAVEERPNMPGTIDQWPNWRLGLPLPLEKITSHPLLAKVASVCARKKRA